MRLESPYVQFCVARMRAAAQPSFLTSFVQGSWITLGLAAVLHCIISATWANATAVGGVLLAWLLVTKYFLRPAMLRDFPLSSYLVLGFTATQFCFPMLFTLVEGKELVYNLDMPYEVFLHSLLALAVLMLTHAAYVWLVPSKSASAAGGSALEKLGLFRPPTDQQVWLIGLTGLVAMFYVYFYMPSQGRETTGALEKLIEALVPFTYAPFFMPFGQLYGRAEKPPKGLMVKLAAFTVLLFVVSMGTNSRGAFMLGFTSVGFAFALGLLLGSVKTKLFTARNILQGMLGVWFLTGPMADIGTAMVMVRNQRADTPRSELVGLTWAAFLDKEGIKAYKTSSQDVNPWSEWDESYMDNIFLARFCNIKFNDLSLRLATQLPQQPDPEVLQYSLDRFFTTFPRPILDLLQLDVDKDLVNSFSYGDFMYYKVTGDSEVLGSRLTGHFAGLGLASFGWWYLAWLGLGILPVYALSDALATRRRVPVEGAGGKFRLMVCFSFCGLLSITGVFQFLPTESVTGIANYLLRGWIQLVLLYLLLYHGTRWLSGWLQLLVGTSAPRRRPLVGTPWPVGLRNH